MMKTTSESRNDNNISELLLKLCKYFAQDNEALSSQLSNRAFRYLSLETSVYLSTPSNEICVINLIKELIKSRNPENVEQFQLLYTNLTKSEIIHDRASLMTFLYNISITPKDSATVVKPTNYIKFEPLLTTTTTALQKNWPSISSAAKAVSSSTNFISNESASVKHIYERNQHHKLNNASTISSTVSRANSQATTISSSAAWFHNNDGPSSSSTTKTISVYHCVPEQELIQNVIFSLQGIQGKFLKRDPCGGFGYSLDLKFSRILTPIQRSLMERISCICYLHKQLRQYCEENEKQSGAIAQAFVSILNNELSDYYRTIALLQVNLKKTGDSIISNNNSSIMENDLSLRRGIFILQDHRIRFEWLAYIAEECSDKKGGALITAIHGFLQHGSKMAQHVSKKVLTAVCKPLFIMLGRWLLDGEINDPCSEFFIESKPNVSADRLWHEKYKVRDSMIPSFISMENARRILATGKSINFLRQICKDNGQLPGRIALQKLFTTASTEVLFAAEQSIEFHETLENVYKSTSLRVLDLLMNKFRLNEHLQSLRRYLLLGQGDFIRHLLELLSPELSKPAGDVHEHTLAVILESAIRDTNAQYEDEDTLNRLGASFMTHSLGDIGWDVFSLAYIVDGPIGTIFQPTMSTYQSLFGALWKAKRTEYILANMRRQQLSMAKLFRKIQELRPVMHVIHILTSRMIHFIHQTQYYFLFEVLECSWAELQQHVNKAECLDDIITGHQKFLQSVQQGVLLDEESRQLFSHLVSIYNFVVNLEMQQEAIYQASLMEFEAFQLYRAKTESKKGFEINVDEENEAQQRVAKFYDFLMKTKLKAKSMAESHDIIVTKFLELLASSSNMNLQLLSVRLSFNDFYKSA